MAGLTQKVAAAEQAQLRCRELENALRDLRAQLKDAQEEAATLKVDRGVGGSCAGATGADRPTGRLIGRRACKCWGQGKGAGVTERLL